MERSGRSNKRRYLSTRRVQTSHFPSLPAQLTTTPHEQHTCREGRTSSEDKSYLKERFEKIVSALFDMDRMLSKAAATLPPFVLRKLTIAIKQLRTRALQVRSEVLPRQPFAFSSKDAIVLATDPMSQVRTPPHCSQALPTVCVWASACDHSAPVVL